MGTREGQYWREVRPGLSGWDPKRVETPASDGFPDVSHIHGLVELKYIRHWPKRASTPLRVEHYSQQQRVFHKRRCKAGGLCHVLIGVEKEHFLFWGEVAAEHLGHMPRMEMIMRADAHWTDGSTMRKELRDEILARSEPR